VPSNEQLAPVARVAQLTTLRLVAGRALRRFALLLPLPLIYALAGLTWIKLAEPSPAGLRVLLAGAVACALVPIIGVASALLQRRPEFWGAQVLDRHYGLAGRLSNALAFSRETNPSPLQLAAIEDASTRAHTLRPREAAPLQLPFEIVISVGLCAALLALAQLEVRSRRFVPEVAPQVAALMLPADDVELLREIAKQAEADAKDPEVLAAARRFNQLVEDLAERRLDQHEVLQRLQQLEQKLAGDEALDKQGLDDALNGVAEALGKHGLTKPAAEAIQQKQLADAEAALKELAKRLRDKPTSVSKAELERLRKALEQASQSNAERNARIEQQRRELEEDRKRLLQKKNEPGAKPLSKSEQQELERKERQLKRLDRQKQSAQSGAKQLSKLDQELAKAAQELMKEMGEAAKHLEQGAQDLNRVAQKQLSDGEKEALKQQLQQLREMLRQNQGSSEQRKQLLERFRQRAAGQQSGKGGEPSGPDGKQSQPGGASKPGSPQFKLGQGGTPIPVPGQGAAQPGKGATGEGTGQEGAQAGAGSDPNVRGEKSDLQGKTQDVAAAGIDSGQGESTSEVVFGAAERGFSGGGYRKVYTDYKTVAEEVMQSDQIPPGYRFYVRRYFQLIRPRE
jgi:hypothetical protein